MVDNGGLNDYKGTFKSITVAEAEYNKLIRMDKFGSLEDYRGQIVEVATMSVVMSFKQAEF